MQWLYEWQDWLYALDSRFISWLFDWQGLIGAILGAVAIASTVWWTLSSENRRRKQEEQALRTALGAEVRHFAKRALNAHKDLADALIAVGKLGGDKEKTWPISVQDAANICRFPEPTIYSHSARNLGMLGEYAHRVVVFYGQLDLIRQVMGRSEGNVNRPLKLAYDEVQFLSAALLNAADAAAAALPAFEEKMWTQKDATYLTRLIEAHEAFEPYKPTAEEEAG